MPKASPIQTSFNSGIFSELGIGRVDLSRYKSSAGVMKNFIPLILGPVVKRSGTKFIAPVKHHDRYTLLMEFEPSVTKSFMLEIGHQYIRVFNGDGSQVMNAGLAITGISNAVGGVVQMVGHGLSTGQDIVINDVQGMTEVNGRRFYVNVLDADSFQLRNYFDNPLDTTSYGAYTSGGTISTPYEITTPYDEDDLTELQFEQSIDVMYIVHQSYPQATLSRVASTSFVYQEASFEWPAFQDVNFDSAKVMTSTGVNGTVTLTTNFDHFTANMVGSEIQISEIVESSTIEWKTDTAYPTLNTRRRYDGNVYSSQTTGTSGTNPPVHLEGDESDGGVVWSYLHSGKGYATITAVTDARTATATVNKRLPDTVLTGSFRWANAAWSDLNGYPRALAFHDLRMYYAGTAAEPQTFWASEVNRFNVFNRGTLPDQSFTYTINSRQNNTIQWMAEGNVLAIGTSRGEFIGHGNRVEDAISAEEVRVPNETGYGSKHIQALKVGSTILFIERRGRKIREYVYDFNINKYKAGDLTVFSDGVIESEIINVSYQQSPNQVAWFTTEQGYLHGMTYDKSQEVIGFHSHQIGGDARIDSTAVTAYSEGKDDRVWMVAKRTINGEVRRYIETMNPQFQPDDDPHEAVFVDSHVEGLTGFDHLEGVNLSATADGAVLGGVITVDDNEIDPVRQEGAVHVFAGLPYTGVLELNRIDAGSADGTAQGKTKRIHSIAVRLVKTGPGLWYGAGDTMDEVHFREPSHAMGEAVPLFTGDVKPRPWPEGSDVDGIMRFEHRLPTPAIIAAVMPQLVTEDNR